MATGLIALTCMLMAAATPDDVWYMNCRRFQIPINLKAQSKDVKDLVLYMSSDEGKTWEIHSTTKPDAKGFEFSSNHDGMFYFNVAAIDHAGKMNPPDPYRVPASQKIYIDTAKPTVRISAERVADEIRVSWEARDEKPGGQATAEQLPTAVAAAAAAASGQ